LKKHNFKRKIEILLDAFRVFKYHFLKSHIFKIIIFKSHFLKRKPKRTLSLFGVKIEGAFEIAIS